MIQLAPPAAVTAARLQQFAPHCDALAWAPALDAEAARCAIDTPKRVAHWLAQLHVETLGFTRFEEDLGWKSPERLARFFSAVRSVADAQNLIARGPQAIANRVYANRNGNGDEASGDGWRYRGMGPPMLTGRANYANASRYTGIDLVGHPEAILTPAIGARVAAEFWLDAGLNQDADRGDVVEITRAINGPALAGLVDRKRQTALALTIWKA